MTKLQAAVLGALAAQANAQGRGVQQDESGIPLSLARCTLDGGCKIEEHKATLDANWRWLHYSGETNYTNCYINNTWSCTSEDCGKQCDLEGLNYTNYGVTEIDNGIQMQYVTITKQGAPTIGSRLYMLDETEENYLQFFMLAQEMTVTLNVSDTHCGVNPAIYFVEMEPTGERYGDNKAGAKYGTGYCDGQCPGDMKFINGTSNNVGWIPNAADPNNNTGIGSRGSCCFEFDLWEGNIINGVYTGHPTAKPYRNICSNINGTENWCGNQADARFTNQTDRSGCPIDPYRLGNHQFYGPGPEFTVNSLEPFDITTQFITDDGTPDGKLIEVKQIITQNGKTIVQPNPKLPGVKGNTMTPERCTTQFEAVKDPDIFDQLGGFANMEAALRRGLTLTLSFWDDTLTFVNWLDAGERGTCNMTEGDPAIVRKQYPNMTTQFSNIRVGPIGSTSPGSSIPTPAPTPGAPTTPAPTAKPRHAPCCSWALPNQKQTCAATSDYCDASEANCNTCGGHWITHEDPPDAIVV